MVYGMLVTFARFEVIGVPFGMESYALSPRGLGLELYDFRNVCARGIEASDLREHIWGGRRHVDRLWTDLREPMPYACAEKADRRVALNRVGSAQKKRQENSM
jgi:hypothetical protein